MADVRWGFIGGGNVTEAKAAPGSAFTQARSRVVAVARTTLERSAAYAAEHGIDRAYGSVADLCGDPAVSAVFVCTPHHLHREHALAALRAGKHVLCEKPLTVTGDDARALVRAAHDAGVVLAVAYYRRFYPIAERLREIVQSGRLGTVTSALVVCHGQSAPRRAAADAPSNWRARVAEAGGGTLADVGAHRIDLLCWLFGRPRTVAATVDRFGSGYDGEDQANVTIRFESRVTAQLDQSWYSGAPRDSLAVYGSEGEATVEDLEGTRLTVRRGHEIEAIDVAPRSAATHRPLVADMVRAMTEGGDVRCTGEDGLLTTLVVEAAYRSAREGRTVEISLTD